MKRNRFSLLILPALLFLGLNLQAQTSVSTDPVGFVCTDLPATGFTYFGVNLTKAPVLTSATTALDADEVAVGVDLSMLDGNNSYSMDITSGTYEGYSAEIASWASQTLTLSEDIEAGGVNPGDFDGSRVVIREIPTIASVFGATNSAGLKPGTFGSADLIYIYTPSGFEKYYYFPGGFGQPAGWRDEAGDLAGSTAIHFGDGLVIETRDTALKKIVISGNVKRGPTNVPILEGFNLVANPSPVQGSHTLASSGLSAGLEAGTAGSADIVYIPSASGGFDTYYYFPGGFGQTAGWREVTTGAISDSTPLPDSGAFFVDRRSGGSSVMITEDIPNN